MWAMDLMNDTVLIALVPSMVVLLGSTVLLGMRWPAMGLVVAAGNPLAIRGIEDLAREGVSIVNRQPGAGTRVLLDYLLSKNGLSPKNIRGYGQQLLTHFDAANRVAAGLADAAIAIRVAAKALGLDFVFLTLEPYELIVPERYAEHPGILALIAATRDDEWRRRVIRERPEQFLLPKE